MKKLLLLCALVCAGQMYGMESVGWKDLPAEVKGLVLVALARSGDNVESAIQDIKQASQVNKELYNIVNDLQGFTVLVHKIADQFVNVTTVQVAGRFKTLIAKKYIELGYSLTDLLDSAEGNSESGHKKIAELIQGGADVNFTAFREPLELAIMYRNLKGVQLLLEAGAKPTNQNLNDAKYGAQMYPNDEKAKSIKELIEEALKK